ncbi:MAG: hypothetical protein DWQ01_09840 [Planctomycetota bacterium]|nr:MAG: hypothetical protein DWQ01_09840 [Planctomycetota bacterium]
MSFLSPTQQQEVIDTAGKRLDAFHLLGDLYSGAVDLCIRATLADLELKSQAIKAAEAQSHRERLRQLPDSVQLAVAKGDISMGHGLLILALSSPLAQVKLAELIVENDLTVEATGIIAMWSRGKSPPSPVDEPELRALWQQLAPLTKDQESGDPGTMTIEGAEAAPTPSEDDPEHADSEEQLDLAEASAAARATVAHALTATLSSPGIDQDFDAAFEAIESTHDCSRNVVLSSLEEYLGRLEGTSFGSIKKNKRFAAKLNRALRQLDCQLVCQSCGNPASLRVEPGNSPHGSFQFLHSTLEGRRNVPHMGRATIPKLVVARRS